MLNETKKGSGPVHRLDALGVFLFDELAFELHGGGQFLVLGGELGVKEEEPLDLLHAGEFDIDAVDFGQDERLHLGRARERGVIAEQGPAIDRTRLS